jgi:hypothetical protein
MDKKGATIGEVFFYFVILISLLVFIYSGYLVFSAETSGIGSHEDLNTPNVQNVEIKDSLNLNQANTEINNSLKS